MLLAVTPSGIGLSVDSNRYLMLKPWAPQDHQFPPLYPACLQLTQFVTGEPPLAASRLFAAWIYGLNIIASGLLVFLACGSIRMAWLAAAFVLLSSASYGVHSWALSEPLFFLLGNLLCLALALYRRDGRGVYWLGACSLAALALLTRYAAGAWILTAVVFLLRRPSRRRILEAGLFLLLACLPLLLWLTIPIPESLQPSRHLASHPPGWRFLQVGLETACIYVGSGLLFWQLPLVGLASWRLLRQGGCNRSPLLPQLLSIWAWFLPVYLIYLWLSACFLDALVIPETRLMSPFWIILVQLVVSLGCRFRWVAWLAVLQCFNSLAPAVGYFETLRLNGQGYTGAEWRESALLRRVERLPAGAPVYTNDPNPFLVYCSHPVKLISPPQDLMGGAPDPQWECRWNGMEQDVRKHGRGYYVAVAGTETFLVPASWTVLAKTHQGLLFQIRLD